MRRLTAALRQFDRAVPTCQRLTPIYTKSQNLVEALVQATTLGNRQYQLRLRPLVRIRVQGPAVTRAMAGALRDIFKSLGSRSEAGTGRPAARIPHPRHRREERWSGDVGSSPTRCFITRECKPVYRAAHIRDPGNEAIL